MERETILISLIDPSPLNPRKTFDEAKLQELAESAKSHGILQPILLRPRLHTINRGPTKGQYERFELVDGERRWRAAQLAGLAEIPAIVRELSDKEVLEIALVTCEQRADVPELEKARGYKKLIDEHGYTADTLAAKIGRSPATVYGLLKLLQLPTAAAKALEAGELPANTALLFARIPNEKLRAQAYKEICTVREMPSLREAKEKIQARFMVELKQAPFNQKDPCLVLSAGACTDCPKQVGNNREEFPEGRADVCTDPACYRSKTVAWGEVMLERAKAEGKKIQTAQESKSLWNEYSPGSLKHNACMVDLDAAGYIAGSHRTWRKASARRLRTRLSSRSILAARPTSSSPSRGRRPSSARARKTARPQRSRGANNGCAMSANKKRKKRPAARRSHCWWRRSIAASRESPACFIRS